MLPAAFPGNVIPLFGYCLRGCGKPAVRFELQPSGEKCGYCADEPRCRPAGQPLHVPAYCDPANEVRGNLYDRNLDVKEIAKRMRQAIKAELPLAKVSVKIRRFAGGQAIDIALQSAPFNCEPLIPMQQWYDQLDAQGVMRPWRENFDPQMAEAMALLKDIHGRWNRDNSDGQSDYFDVNYYGGVTGPNGMNW